MGSGECPCSLAVRTNKGHRAIVDTVHASEQFLSPDLTRPHPESRFIAPARRCAVEGLSTSFTPQSLNESAFTLRMYVRAHKPCVFASHVRFHRVRSHHKGLNERYTLQEVLCL